MERYNQIHAFFRARVEHVFTRIWPFAIVHQVWRGKGLEGACELQRRIHVLFNFVNFELSRKVMYELAGVWPHTPEGAPPAEHLEYEVPRGVLEDDSANEDDEEEDADVAHGSDCAAQNDASASTSEQSVPTLSSGLTEGVQQGRERSAPSNRVHVWQPRLTRSETARLRNDMALSASELHQFLHTDAD